ncbi:MAG: hypothetical protein ABIM60_01300, partial [candidate division WOR-3 bacterium]
SPAYRLDVVGASRIQGDLYINSWPIRVASQPTTGYVLKWDGSAFTPQPDIGGVGGSGTATQVAFWTSSTTIGGNNNLWWDNTNARLGIGTSSPAYRLDVVGASRIQGDLYINSWPISVTSTPTVGHVLKWNGTAFVPQPDAEHSVYNVTLTSLLTTTSTTFVDMPGMQITFTPRHDVVYVFVSAKGRLTQDGYYAQAGQAIMYIRVVNATTGAHIATSGNNLTDYDDINGMTTAGNVAINGIPVSVTPGQQVTFKLQWRCTVLWAVSPWMIAINPPLTDVGDHCIFTIID